MFFQFQIFRETKEKELQNLLHAKRELDTKVYKLNHGLSIDDRHADDRGSSGGNESALGTSLGSVIF